MLSRLSRRPLILAGRYGDTVSYLKILDFIFMPLFAFMLLLGMCAYGPIQGLMAAESTLAVSASPLGVSDFLSVDVGGRGLRHSLVYDDPRVISAVVNWLKGTRSERP